MIKKNIFGRTVLATLAVVCVNSHGTESDDVPQVPPVQTVNQTQEENAPLIMVYASFDRNGHGLNRGSDGTRADRVSEGRYKIGLKSLEKFGQKPVCLASGTGLGKNSGANDNVMTTSNISIGDEKPLLDIESLDVTTEPHLLNKVESQYDDAEFSFLCLGSSK